MGVVVDEVSRHGGGAWGLCRRSSRGVVGNPNFVTIPQPPMKRPRKWENRPFSPTKPSPSSHQPSRVPQVTSRHTRDPSPKTPFPAPPAPTPLIGTPAKTSWGGGENPGFRSTGLRPLQTPQAKRPDATTPVRIRKRGTQNERPLLRRFVSALDGLGGAVLSRRASSAPVSSFLSFLFHGMEILWE